MKSPWSAENLLLAQAERNAYRIFGNYFIKTLRYETGKRKQFLFRKL